MDREMCLREKYQESTNLNEMQNEENEFVNSDIPGKQPSEVNEIISRCVHASFALSSRF